MKHSTTIAIIFIGLWAYLSEAESQLQRDETEQYCEMVKAKRWPDYEKRFDKDCSK